jgi:hypothetical protein
MPRAAFEAHLARTLGERDVTDWTYDAAHWRTLDPALEPLEPRA